ncbi:MAG: 50S ribosome-binding GTPase, partial [Candidatus Methanomethyliaceae archaeon]|nr:50S ribosome-binding GTPase [Candidatus Methanomethyliaceae archaeon]
MHVVPANLPPQAKAAERRYTEAKFLPEKIKYLQEFISTIPEHKGNEKMRGYLRRRLAQLKDELEDQKKRRAVGGGGGGFSFKKEGAAQVVILGMTGSGKSSLLMKVTNAKSEVADHPFTTKQPVPGMMSFEDIQF